MAKIPTKHAPAKDEPKPERRVSEQQRERNAKAKSPEFNQPKKPKG